MYRRGSRLAAAAVVALLGGLSSACGDDDDDATVDTSSEDETSVTTEGPTEAPSEGSSAAARLHEASSARYERSDGERWTASLSVGDVQTDPSSAPSSCAFDPSTDAIIPFELAIDGTGALALAQLVLVDSGGNEAHSPVGYLQGVVGLRSDQQILVDAGSECIDLTFAGYAEHPTFDVSGTGSPTLEGVFVLVGYLDASGDADTDFVDAMNFRWTATNGLPPNIQLVDGGRTYSLELTGATGSPVGGGTSFSFSID